MCSVESENTGTFWQTCFDKWFPKIQDIFVFPEMVVTLKSLKNAHSLSEYTKTPKLIQNACLREWTEVPFLKIPIFPNCHPLCEWGLGLRCKDKKNSNRVNSFLHSTSAELWWSQIRFLDENKPSWHFKTTEKEFCEWWTFSPLASISCLLHLCFFRGTFNLLMRLLHVSISRLASV